MKKAFDRLTSVLDGISDALMALDPEWRYVYVNTKAADIIGKNREEIIGRCIWELLPDLVGTPLEAEMRRAVRDSVRIDFETFDARRERWLELSLMPSKDGLSVSAREITERRRGDVAEELARVAQSVTESLDVTAVTERIVEAVVGLFKVRASGLRLLAPDGSLVGIAFGGGMKKAFAPGHVLGAGPASVSGLAVIHGAAAWTENAFADTRLRLDDDVRAGMMGAGDGAVLAVPLRAKGRVFGALSIADYPGRRFTQADAEMLQAFADQAALAVENARLYEDARRRQREAEVVAELARQINASLDLGTTLQRLLEGARELCESDLARIALHDPRTGKILLHHWVGTRWEGYHSAMTVEAGKGSGGHVLTSGKPFRTERYAEDPRISRDYMAGVIEEGILAQMVVPVQGEGEIVGLLYVDRRSSRPFTDQDEAILLRLADHAAIAIRNARLYQREQEARGAAEAANRAKDDFLATLSHELRTPLNAMLGWVNMLRTGQLSPTKVQRALESIERNTRLQAQLINDLLDVSRIVAGKLALEKQPTDLATIISHAVEALQRDAEAKGIRVTIACDPLAGPVFGDAIRLHQIVANLFSNAVKFTPSDGLIEVTLDRHDGRARLAVRDSGQGIAPEILPYVFDRFRQADSPNTRPHTGLGLGLAIVRNLVELHDGSVHAESAGEGQGATFTVELPIMAIGTLPAPPTSRTSPSTGPSLSPQG